MPNTPALIGQGIAGLFARAAVSAADRAAVEAVLAPTGQLLWFEREAQLDAVTALSGSRPGLRVLLSRGDDRCRRADGPERASRRALLAQQTFAGAAALAQQSDEPVPLLRERVTSKGGTTHAAIAALDAAQVKAAFVQALHAAHTRAVELGKG